MVAKSDDVVAVVAVVVVPVKSQVVAWCDFDRVGRLDIAHNVAAKINRIEVFDGRVGVPACVRTCIVGWRADTFEEALIDAIHEDTLVGLAGRPVSVVEQGLVVPI